VAELAPFAMSATVVDVAALPFGGYLAATFSADEEIPESEDVLLFLVSVPVRLEYLLDLAKEL
jgi:hypothetical protein